MDTSKLIMFLDTIGIHKVGENSVLSFVNDDNVNYRVDINKSNTNRTFKISDLENARYLTFDDNNDIIEITLKSENNIIYIYEISYKGYDQYMYEIRYRVGFYCDGLLFIKSTIPQRNNKKSVKFNIWSFLPGSIEFLDNSTLFSQEYDYFNLAENYDYEKMKEIISSFEYFDSFVEYYSMFNVELMEIYNNFKMDSAQYKR